MGSGILVWKKQAVAAHKAAMAAVPCLLVSPSLNWALWGVGEHGEPLTINVL